MRPNIIIFREQLLPLSEMFIRSQAKALRNFTPVYAGTRAVGDFENEHEPILVSSHSGISRLLRELAFKSCGWAPTFREALRSQNPVLIHAHFGPDACRVLPIAERLGVPLVVTFHGYDATISDSALRKQSLGRRLYVQQRDRLAQKATKVIAVSNFVREQLLLKGFPPARVVVHYVGIDTTKLIPHQLTRREPLVLFVGRLVEVKGCEYLIQAMTEVQKTNPNAELVVIGDGPLRKELEHMAGGIVKRYRFLGAQPHSAVKHWMNRASVFCTPSTVAASGAAEGFGLVFAEAQAMGLPVAGFATGGVGEAVEHNVTGLLASDKNVPELASYIGLLLQNQSLWRRFSYQARARVTSLFDLNTQTVKLEQIFTDAIHDYQLATRCSVFA